MKIDRVHADQLKLLQNRVRFIKIAILGCVYTRILGRFYMEPFRRGTDRLPVYTMSWNLSVQNRFFPCIHGLVVPHL